MVEVDVVDVEDDVDNDGEVVEDDIVVGIKEFVEEVVVGELVVDVVVGEEDDDVIKDVSVDDVVDVSVDDVVVEVVVVLTWAIISVIFGKEGGRIPVSIFTTFDCRITGSNIAATK